MKRDPLIEKRGKELETHLANQGWKVIVIEEDYLEWWAAQIWTIESQWSPNGFQLYITFLVDPQSEDVLWTIGISKEYPTDRFSADSEGDILVRNVWNKRLPAFLSKISSLREQSQTDI